MSVGNIYYSYLLCVYKAYYSYFLIYILIEQKFLLIPSLPCSLLENDPSYRNFTPCGSHRSQQLYKINIMYCYTFNI